MSAVIPDPALTDWVPLGGVGGGGSMIALQEIVLSAAQATIDFTNIPQGYRNLQVVVDGRGDFAATSVGLLVQFNGDTGANYDRQQHRSLGAASSAGETFGATSVLCGGIPGATAPANLSGSSYIDVPNYTSAFNKTLHASAAFKFGVTTGSMAIEHWAGFWRSVAAINRITVSLSSGSFVAGSRATLYGLAAPGTTIPGLPLGPVVYRGAKARASGTQALGASTTIGLAFDTEDWDTEDIHDVTTNTGRLTCKTAGRYAITAGCGLTAVGEITVSLLRNGAQSLVAFHDTYYGNPSVQADLVVNDYITVSVANNLAGARTIAAGAWLEMHQIG